MPAGFEEYVPAPGGWLVHSSCMHEVPHGAALESTSSGVTVRVSGRVVARHSRCAHELVPASKLGEFYDGWLAYTQFDAKESIDFSSSVFNVPKSLPKYEPTRLYLFNALQNNDWIPKVDPAPKIFDIIQPVLQTPRDGGAGWSVKSWWVTLNAGAFASPELPLALGDQLLGTMQRTGPASYFINSVSQMSGKNTSVSFTDMARPTSQPWAFNTLECYGCASCDYEPVNDPSIFSKIVLQGAHKKPITPVWQAKTSPQPKCSEKAIVKSPSEVEIQFKST